ncbi:MAG: hypothetical protein R2747_11365 [Pyrinomonadaceae bacterium]
MKYQTEAYIITHDSPSQADVKGERINIPVHSFEVNGGANRKINVHSTDEISISSEFEQARTHKNIIFYIPPTRDFLAVKLLSLRTPTTIRYFDMRLIVNVYSGGIKTQSLRLGADSAWFSKIPIPVGNTPPLLMAEVHFHSAELLHGKFDRKRRKMVHETM